MLFWLKFSSTTGSTYLFRNLALRQSVVERGKLVLGDDSANSGDFEHDKDELQQVQEPSNVTGANK